MTIHYIIIAPIRSPLPRETVPQCENPTNVILSHRRRISRFLQLTKARSFGYRLRMTLHTVSDGKKVRGAKVY
jgi:hypothetical protein